MFNIVVFSGGSGSVAIQEGLSTLYENNTYNLDIIINAYDNGKSSGICRKIFDSKILGPSDLRKNQLTQFRVQYADRLHDKSSKESGLYELFQRRISAPSKEDYYIETCNILEESRDVIGDDDVGFLKSLVNYFFFEDIDKYTWRATLEGVNFQDFSIANIFYSSAAAMHGYSMRIAGKIIANFLKIKDNVHLISDVNLYLQAKTESGNIIPDEADIVTWDNSDDKIESVCLLREGQEYIPTVDEEVDLSEVRSIIDVVESADLIIFSSGTQWSSLIPSYMHSGLRKILADSNAKKYVIMNTIEDHDMKGVSADEVFEILGRYIPMEDVTAVVSDDAVSGMNVVSMGRSVSGHISGAGDRHDPTKLVGLIMKDFFGLSDDEVTYVYDLDGTLWDERENERGQEIGTENMNLFNGIIHSGNNYEHVRDVFKEVYRQEQIIDIYTDFGAVYFTSADYTPELLTYLYIINPEVVDVLKNVETFKGKIHLRGEGCVITIKPLVNRRVQRKRVQECLAPFDGKYIAYISGHTSIDIMDKDYNKKTMLKMIMDKQNLDPSHVVFVGNETVKGAEANIQELGVQTIQVDDVYECNILLKTIKFIKGQKNE